MVVRDKPLKIGLISDTHNLVRPQAIHALTGVDRILHAGDICGPEVLDELRTIAPVVAVRGNNDFAMLADSIQATERVAIGGISIFLVHDIGDLDFDPKATGFSVVVSGHSHRPVIDDKNGVLFVNPGSAGPRRFKLPVSIATLEICGGKVRAQLHLLQC